MLLRKSLDVEFDGVEEKEFKYLQREVFTVS